MRILHTVASLDPSTGGPARSVPGLAGALAQQGLDVHVWSPDIPEGFPEAGFTLHRGSLEAALDNMGKPDVIHDHGLWLPVNHHVAKVARGRGIPRVVSPRGMLEPWAINHKKWKKKLAWWLYQRADLKSAAALHATADSEARQFEHLGLHLPVHVIPNGVDLPQLSSLSAQFSGFSSPVSGLIPQASSPKTALFLSRIHPKKGLPLLVEAWAKVRPQGWRMRVVGPDDGGHTQAVAALVVKAGLGHEWSFEGAKDDLAKWEYYRDADLFILPTYSENFGICIAEALASGTPVITTTGTPWEGLQEHQCGWWVEPTVADLANALAQATSIPSSDREAMGLRGRDWMTQEFSWEGIARQMIKSYKTILYEEH